jgi:hypothetical protein
LPYTNLVLSGVAVTTTGNLTTTAGFTVTGAGASFDVGGTALTVGTTLTVSSGGLLIMTNAAGQVTVTGNALFSGGNETGLLSAGTLRVRGNFSEVAGSFQAFAASGTHRVILDGTTAQTVSFNTPGAGSSVFNDLDISAQTGGVTLASNIVVARTLIAQPVAGTPTISGGGRTVTTGVLSVNGLKLDNAPLIWNESAAGAVQFDNVQFVNFPGNVTQFKASAFGAALLTRSITMTGLTFTHLAAAPGLYVDLTSANLLGVTLTLSGASESPQVGGNGPTFSNPPNQTTVNGARVLWP